MYPISKFGEEVKKPEDLPLEPHWQIWVQDSYIPWTGYEETDGRASRQTRWRTWAYTDQAEWKADLLELNRRLIDPKRTLTRDVFLAFEAGGRVMAEVSIGLAGAPLPRRAP